MELGGGSGEAREQSLWTQSQAISWSPVLCPWIQVGGGWWKHGQQLLHLLIANSAS